LLIVISIIILNGNIPIATFLSINRWCKAKKPSLMRGRGIGSLLVKEYATYVEFHTGSEI
jgi:hypothetical protein